MRSRTPMLVRRLRAAVLALGVFAPLLMPTAVAHAQAPGKLSFVVFGDSRTMMYLPFMETQKDEAIKLLVEMFNLVMPEKYAEEVVRKDVRLTYDPKTHELVQIVMPFMTRSEVMT